MSRLYEKIPVALPQIWDELPKLFGDKWPRVQADIWELLRQLEAGDPVAAKAIDEVIAAIPAAHKLLQDASKSILEKSANPAGIVSMERYVEVPLMYGTDRQRTGKNYGGNANEGRLALGVVKVSIPEDHRMGEMEHPPRWKLGFGWDPKEHVKLLSIEELEYNAFIVSTRQMIVDGSENEALVFIHGYNVSFADAARRGAQLAYDLRFKGIAMLYSWPSKGKLTPGAYIADSDLAKNTRSKLMLFLTEVMADLGVDGIHIIAHSMGNQPLTEVLKDLSLSPPDKEVPLRQVVFAAPDVNTATFKELAAKFHHNIERCTLYANSDDKALKLSRKFNTTIRAGDSGGHLTVFDGVDIVDVTGVDTSFDGHSVFSDNRSVLADLELLIGEELPPENRPLLDKFGSPSNRYWKFRR